MTEDCKEAEPDTETDSLHLYWRRLNDPYFLDRYRVDNCRHMGTDRLACGSVDACPNCPV